MHFMIFGFCSVAHCMRMSHGYISFSSFTKLYDRSVFAVVSRHAHVQHLRLSVVNVWDAFCVLFWTFVLKKFI